jgi:glycosyltransferase involved in cell wall biosynthesis
VLELLLGELAPEWVQRVILLEDGPAAGRFAAPGRAVEVIPTGRRAGLLAGAVRLRRTLRAQPPAVVHANGIKAALVAAPAVAGTGIPVVWVKHDFSWDGLLARLVAAGCTEVVGVSGAVVETLRRGVLARLRRPRVAVVPNGVPRPEISRAAARAALDAELGLAAGAQVILLLGRLHPAKGQLELLGAVRRIRETVPAAHVLLAGGDDPTQPVYAAEVRRRAAEHARDAPVHLLGHRQDAAALVAAADVLVIPSVPDERGMGREGFGLAGVEAMAAGTPVVGYRDGALPEVLGDAGILVTPGDRRALAAGIVAALTDPVLRDDLVTRGRARYEARYRVVVMAAAMQHRYRAAASARRRRPPARRTARR